MEKTEQYFNAWWTQDFPETGFNKTAMLDFAEQFAESQLAEYKGNLLEVLEVTGRITKEDIEKDNNQTSNPMYKILKDFIHPLKVYHKGTIKTAEQWSKALGISEISFYTYIEEDYLSDWFEESNEFLTTTTNDDDE